MHIVAAGVSGFLGTQLTAALTAAGHQVTRLVRSDPTGPDESLWNPHSGDIDSSVFDGADAVVNLCGVGVGDHRWTARLQAPDPVLPGQSDPAAGRRMRPARASRC